MQLHLNPARAKLPTEAELELGGYTGTLPSSSGMIAPADTTTRQKLKNNVRNCSTDGLRGFTLRDKSAQKNQDTASKAPGSLPLSGSGEQQKF